MPEETELTAHKILDKILKEYKTMTKAHELVNYIFYSMKSLIDYFPIKFMSAFAYMVYSFAFDVNHSKAIIAILILIIFDFITGISAAKISGEEIKSAKVLRSAIKTFVYLLLISAGHMFELTTSLISFADDMLIAFLAVTELISLIENAGKMGFAVPNQLLNKLKSYRDTK